MTEREEKSHEQAEGSRNKKSVEFAPNWAPDSVSQIERNGRCSPSYIEDPEIEIEPKSRNLRDTKIRRYFFASPQLMT